MNNTQIKTLFSEDLETSELKAFRYKLGNIDTPIKGVLHSNNLELSISFQNQNEIEIESLETLLTNTLELPPSKRILSWKQEVSNCAYITGTVRNLSQTKETVNLYLLLE